MSERFTDTPRFKELAIKYRDLGLHPSPDQEREAAAITKEVGLAGGGYALQRLREEAFDYTPESPPVPSYDTARLERWLLHRALVLGGSRHG